MAEKSSIIAAFSEDQTIQLTGISKSQLRYWHRTQFYRPKYVEGRRISFSRIYSFKDIVALRVLNVLRNQFRVPLQHLRDVRARLGGLCDDPSRWIETKLYPLNGRVIWHDPDTELPQEVASGQYLSSVDLNDIVQATKRAVALLRAPRARSIIGTVERSRYIAHNAEVIAGTRIPVGAIKRFAEAGYTVKEIRAEYPDLTDKDVRAAIKYRSAA